MQGNDSAELENFKILRSIWKNTYDKILEIKVMNRRSWNDSKKEILEEEKKKVDTKYDKEYQEQYIANKIQISEARNTSNLNKMRKRNELIEKLATLTLEKVKNFAKPENQKYKDLVKQLILQGMVKLLEPVCIIICRRNDVDFIKKLLKDLESDFVKLMHDQTGEEYTCTLEIDTKEFLENEQ
jgi:V-type H+-transporting ATPase subunit E